VLQSIPYAIVVVNRDGRMVFVNTQVETMFGYCREELLNQPVTVLMPDRFHQTLQEYRDRCLSAPQTRPSSPGVEGYGRRKDGSEFPLDLLLSPLQTEEGVLVTSTLRDVTRDKRTEEALHRQAMLIELSYEPIFVWDLEAGIVMWNRGCEQLYGFPKADAIGRVSHALLQTVFPESFAQYHTSLLRHRQWSGELRHTTRDGHEVIVESRHQLVESTGRWLVLESNRNITLRKQAEETQRQLLERLVTAQEEERQRISRELHDQMGQHLSVLLLGLKSVEPDVQSLPAVWQRLRHVQELTDQLGQEIHHLAWALRSPDLAHQSLETVLRNYVEDWSQRCGITVDFHSRNCAGWQLNPHIETSLYRIVQETLTNVLKHAQADNVSILLERRRDYILLIVEDNGKGFDVEAVLGMPQGQSRLGVLGMQERTALIGGSLEMESSPGAGTTVFVRIPVPNT
jgi:PAS domain S-box-containing protein